jgi:hypothetical protein
MFKKLLVVTAALAVSTTALADVKLSGLYEGTLNTEGAYTQDITTTLTGTEGNSAITVIFDKEFAVDDMYVTTTSGPLTFTLGDKSGTSPDEIVLGVALQVGAVNLGLNQVSGGATSVDASGVIAGVSLAMTDVTSTTRETTGSYAIAGITTEIVHSNDAVGTNLDGSLSREFVGLGTIKVSMANDSANVDTKAVSLTRRIWTAGWEQVGSATGVTTLKASLAF